MTISDLLAKLDRMAAHTPDDQLRDQLREALTKFRCGIDPEAAGSRWAIGAQLPMFDHLVGWAAHDLPRRWFRTRTLVELVFGNGGRVHLITHRVRWIRSEADVRE